jgi:hypothetical protein
MSTPELKATNEQLWAELQKLKAEFDAMRGPWEFIIEAASIKWIAVYEQYQHALKREAMRAELLKEFGDQAEAQP